MSITSPAIFLLDINNIILSWCTGQTTTNEQAVTIDLPVTYTQMYYGWISKTDNTADSVCIIYDTLSTIKAKQNNYPGCGATTSVRAFVIGI